MSLLASLEKGDACVEQKRQIVDVELGSFNLWASPVSFSSPSTSIAGYDTTTVIPQEQAQWEQFIDEKQQQTTLNLESIIFLSLFYLSGDPFYPIVQYWLRRVMTEPTVSYN